MTRSDLIVTTQTLTCMVNFYVNRFCGVCISWWCVSYSSNIRCFFILFFSFLLIWTLLGLRLLNETIWDVWRGNHLSWTSETRHGAPNRTVFFVWEVMSHICYKPLVSSITMHWVYYFVLYFCLWQIESEKQPVELFLTNYSGVLEVNNEIFASAL